MNGEIKNKMGDNAQLIEDIDALKALLEDAAQAQKNMDEHQYRSLKLKLLRNPHVQGLLPTFLKSRATLTSFRSLSQQFPSYVEQRKFIEQEFEPVLTYLYQDLADDTGTPKVHNVAVDSKDPIEANASLLLSIMVDQDKRSATNSELQMLSGLENGYDVNDAIERLEENGAVEVTWIRSSSSDLAGGDVRLKARGKSMYNETKAQSSATSEGATLIIHGHDETNLLRLKNFLASKLHLPEPVIMAEQTTPGATLPEKFERLAARVEFAVALMTPDDEGKAKTETDMKDRCRQNVIVEIGWFWGKLGREHVLILVKDRVEMPSDLQGLEYFRFKNNVEEVSEKIRDFYKAHGVKID